LRDCGEEFEKKLGITTGEQVFESIMVLFWWWWSSGLSPEIILCGSGKMDSATDDHELESFINTASPNAQFEFAAIDQLIRL
jgi:hypothetical protein